MRYAAPVAMPVGLGEWLGAELEARGVEAASLYARAVLSILLHSEVAEVEAELDHPERDPNAWNPRAALELELRLERHTKETRRGRPSIKKNYSPKSSGSSQTKRSSNMATPSGKNHGTALLRRRPHSWNGGDEEALKKCAAIECLLSATDDGQWGPVEKLVDELCTRLKLLQLEQQSCCGDIRSNKYRRTTIVGGSAPERITDQRASNHSPSESDSFTSVSSPEAGPEDYSQAFPPLEYLSDSDQGTLPTTEPIWNVRKNTASNDNQKTRVRFVRMTGTRLSPPPSLSTLFTVQSYGDSCPSETYFGDCSRDSSLERPSIGIEAAETAVKTITAAKGRLYERGADFSGGELASVNDALENAFKSLRQLQEDPVDDPEEEYAVAEELPALPNNIGGTNWESDWGQKAMKESDGSNINIWAPLESDWALLGPETMLNPWSTDSFAAQVPTDAAVQLSLALLNHHPEKSGFSPVLAKSLMLHTPKESLPKSSKLMEWLANLAANGAEQKQQESGIVDDYDEEEIESILKKEPPAEIVLEHHLVVDEEEEQENLLTSPKTHFCPIQQEGDAEVQVSDGATFDVDAQPDEVHFLRSPSGALYLPDSEENGDGWKGWAKYMIYKSPPSPSPLLALEAEPSAMDQQVQSSRATTPFTLKFRVVQTEKYCQTDSRLSIDHSKLSAGPLAISSPFVASFSTSTGSDVFGTGDVWKFDAKAIALEAAEEYRDVVEEQQEVKEAVIQELDAKEEELDGLLSEVWSTAAALIASDEEDDVVLVQETPLVDKLDGFCGLVAVAEAPITALTEVDEATIAASANQNEVEEFDLDELWNPFMDETGEEQVDVCEWVPQTYRQSGQDDIGDQWTEEDALAIADSWPPPNIPVEYLDDEFFEEIYGSLDSMKTSETASIGGGGSKNSRRRRRRSSKNQAPARRPKRPCSFFVEGECRRPDCKFSHDLGSITCRFWIESSCFKGDECPFLHGVPAKESNRNCSDAELSESYGSGEEPLTPHCFRERGGKAAKKFQFDLEADFPSLSQAPSKVGSIASSVGSSRSGPIVSQSRPIAITQGFAAADQTGSSLENTGPADNGGLKRRRKRFCPRPTGINLVGTSSETSPVETVSIMGKRSRKVAKITLGVPGVVLSTKRDKKRMTTEAVLVQSKERRRTKSEHDSGSVAGGPSRSRLSSSYKEG